MLERFSSQRAGRDRSEFLTRVMRLVSNSKLLTVANLVKNSVRETLFTGVRNSGMRDSSGRNAGIVDRTLANDVTTTIPVTVTT